MNASATARASAGKERLVVVARARAADHDLVLLDRDLDGPVAGPVLRVDGVVRDRGVEPEAVALLAVVERRLDRAVAVGAPRAPAAARAPPTRLRLVVVVRLAVAVLRGPGLGARRLGGVELGGDRRVILRAEVDLVVEVRP